ncbi:MAG: phospho-N-acetylmuramoyl-pentapeptide-transferase [Lentisphaeria bacterium]|nr:phospho-N-acetylmuramoyl-pentapeptide-transferase [Lentisphaeria bacterium]
MLPYLASHLTKFWGPFRLLESYLVLMGVGSAFGALLCWYLLPKLWDNLPHDRGKALVQGSEKAKGKPTGAGVLIVSFIMIILVFVMPFNLRVLGVMTCLFAVMLTGYLDDASKFPWSESKKGFLDVVIVVLTALCFTELQPMRIWIPFVKEELTMNWWWYVPLAAFLLFVCINAVNCSDGVDGLAGSLSIMTLICMGVFLYAVIGHNQVAEYLNVPHYGSGAQWALMAFVSAGVFAGYLWHNAYPSSVMMGDAGSRYLGLLIGVCAMASGNLFLFLAVAPILMINGGTGLVKLLILRFLRKLHYDIRQPLRNVNNPQNAKNFASDEEVAKQIWIVRMLNSIRFPLHDHCRKKLMWSETQILVRFMLLQALLTPLLFLLVIKLR